jgi:hypothetical protein
MNLDVLIPISLFACIAYSLKVVVDAYTRRKIVESRGSEDMVRSLLEGETLRRRNASLHWGCVLAILGGGFGIIQMMGVETVTPGVIAILLAATGLGNLLYYGIDRLSKA